MPAIDPDYARKHYAANKHRYMENQNKRRQDKREWLLAYKTGKSCKYCPENHPCCLDFHHRDKDKVGAVSYLIRTAPRARVIAEITKCDLVCANCHRKIHAGVIQ